MTQQPVVPTEIQGSAEENFATRLADARRTAAMSPAELTQNVRAYGLDFRQEHVAELESGGRPVTLVEALVLAEVLGIALPDHPAQVRAELHVYSYPQEIAMLEGEFQQLVERLDSVQLAAVQVLARSLSLRTLYGAETQGPGETADKQLVASLTSLVDNTTTMKNMIGSLRSEFDG